MPAADGTTGMAGPPPDVVACFIVGLADSYRGTGLEEQLELLDLPVAVVQSLDGRGLSERELAIHADQEAARLLQRRELTGGEVGCAVGHRRAHRAIAEAEVAWGLVLEDDAELLPGFATVLQDLCEVEFDGPVVLQLFARCEYAVARGPSIGIGDSMLIETRWPSPGAVAYAINAEAAQLSLARSQGRRVSSVADWPVEWAYDVSFYVLHPQVARLRGIPSLIQVERAPLEQHLRTQGGRLPRLLIALSGIRFIVHRDKYPTWRSYWRHEIVRGVLLTWARERGGRVGEDPLAPRTLRRDRRSAGVART